MTSKELKNSILAAEGRTVCAEMVVCRESLMHGITNAEIARACGADLMLLNGFDLLNPKINGLDNEKELICKLKKLVGRPIGANIEPIDYEAEMLETRLEIEEGRRCSEKTLQAAELLGLDFICLTGNPGTGVTNTAITKAIKLAKQYFSGLIVAGKMHGSGVNELICDLTTVELFIAAGADIILVPAVGTVPGFTDKQLFDIVNFAHKKGALVLTAIGTSQESSSKAVIEQLAIRNKTLGVDIQHIGDAGYSGLAPAENIFTLSTAIRGFRHTLTMIARSINR
ncbi:haloacid dehalogenase-like hydrolase [Clostridium botulinum]